MVIKAKLGELIAQSPQTPGIYIFKNSIGAVLYVGKAINLRKRLLYYTKNREDLYPKTAKFLEQADKLDWIEVRNDLEAILLEINIIRTLKPKYNSVSKDDKRPLYIHLTNDTHPRIRTARYEIPGTGEYIGPFPSSQKLRTILKSLRRIFPFCSCPTRRKSACMYADLGLCVPSPANISTREEARAYKKNINRIRLFLRGKIDKVVKQLEKEMNAYAQTLEYEKAAKVKEQITAIQALLSDNHHIASYLSDDLVVKQIKQSQAKALAEYFGIPFIHRIEGYDIANTAGTNPTAAMVVFEEGFPNSSEYRKFKITQIKGANDPLMMYHVLTRRFQHPEWKDPDFILIDGGKTQVAAALKALDEIGKAIPIAGLAKRFEQLVIPRGKSYEVITAPLDTPYLTLLRAVRDEAHRFTTTYHKHLRQKAMIGQRS